MPNLIELQWASETGPVSTGETSNGAVARALEAGGETWSALIHCEVVQSVRCSVIRRLLEGTPMTRAGSKPDGRRATAVSR